MSSPGDTPAACLLLHGFSGTPFEMEPPARALRKLGLEVELPLLPGHGTRLADFQTTFFRDWLAAAEDGYKALAGRYERVFLIGFSMGGALSLLLASRFPAAGVVAIATPMWLYRIFPWQVRDPRLPLLPLLRHVLRGVPMPRRSPEAKAITPSEGYEGFMPLAQLHSLGQGLAQVRRALPQVTAPVLIVQDARDRTVGAGTGRYIAKKLGSADVALHYTRAEENITGKHQITTHRETREQVAGLCADFVRRLLPGK